MTRKFVQTPPFLSAWKLMGLDDHALSALEDALLLNQEAGDRKGPAAQGKYEFSLTGAVKAVEAA